MFALIAAGVMIFVCVSAIKNGHSIVSGLYEIFIYGSCIVFWWRWIAMKTS